MKVMLVGGGGREHALAWKFKRDQPDIELIAAPGNPGIAELARCVAVPATDIPGLLGIALAERPDLVVVGPEAPLAGGIVDLFREHEIPIFGPTQGAAEIESSKAFAKRIMEEAGVPTARATICADAQSARAAVAEGGAPVVIKASGLAAGKGVFVCRSEAEAYEAIAELMDAASMGQAGSTVLVEEHMEGEEISVLALTDGTTVLPMIPAQDHKRLRDGDLGPNTGGMGAYAPVSLGGSELMPLLVKTVFAPVLNTLREHGRPFTGLLYAGLMLTERGPRVVEFNCRFGDPETQALLPLLKSSLLDPVLSIARWGTLRNASALRWEHGASVATVVAAAEYPGACQRRSPIQLPVLPDHVRLFHSGTARDGEGRLVTAGGRVLTVVATGPTMEEAQERSRRAAEGVRFEGAQFRRDIGRRELARHAGAA